MLNQIFVRPHNQNIFDKFKLSVKIFDAARIKIFHAAIFSRVQVQIKFILQPPIFSDVVGAVDFFKANEFYVRVHRAQNFFRRAR